MLQICRWSRGSFGARPHGRLSPIDVLDAVAGSLGTDSADPVAVVELMPEHVDRLAVVRAQRQALRPEVRPGAVAEGE